MTRSPRLAACGLALVLAATGCTSSAPTTTDVATPGPLVTATPAPSATPAPTPTPLTLADAIPGVVAPMANFVAPAPVVTTPGSEIVVTVGGTTGLQWRTTNVGLSFEMTEVVDPRWEPADDNPLTVMLKALDRPSLRFGGNSVDRRMWWTSAGEARPSWATATVTPADLQRLGRTLRAVDATCTIVLDLGHYDPERAADMAFHAHEALGDRLVAVTIGNEPNGFYIASAPDKAMRDASWSTAAYVEQARAYVAAIHARVPGLSIVGPGAFDAPWWRAFAQAGLPNTVALSEHWYPLWSCLDRTGTTDERAQPTVANLTSPWLHEKANYIIGMGRDTAAANKLPLWIEEIGSTSCGAGEVGRTQAQALWTVDIALNAAANAAHRTNFHSTLLPCNKGNPMSTVCSDTTEAGGPLEGQSNMAGLVLAAQVGEGTIMRTNVDAEPAVHAYAVTTATGLDVVVVNMADPTKTGASPFHVAVPAGLKLTHASLLTAPALAEKGPSTLIPLSPADPANVERLNAGSAILLRYAR